MADDVAKTPDEIEFEYATSMSVRTVNLTFSAKRTIKVGDEFHGFEASESWTMRHEAFDTILPGVARKVALIHGPSLIKNVIMALHVGGVMSLADAKQTVERVKRVYGLLAGGPGDKGGDQSDLRPTDGTGDSVDPDAGVGDGVSAGQAAGVPPEAEHGH